MTTDVDSNVVIRNVEVTSTEDVLPKEEEEASPHKRRKLGGWCCCCIIILAFIIGLAVGLTRKVAIQTLSLRVVTAMVKLPVT